MGTCCRLLMNNFCCCCTICIKVEFCLSGNTYVTVKGKENPYKKPVSEVNIDDLILSFNGKDLIYSKVILINKDEGLKNFFTFKVKDKSSNIKMISATENHSMIIFNKDEIEGIQFKYSRDVKIGDLVRTTEGIGEIIEINKEKLNNSYKLVVEHGTVIANDILVGAFYIKENEQNLRKIKKIIETAKIPIENEDPN